MCCQMASIYPLNNPGGVLLTVFYSTHLSPPTILYVSLLVRVLPWCNGLQQTQETLRNQRNQKTQQKRTITKSRDLRKLSQTLKNVNRYPRHHAKDHKQPQVIHYHHQTTSSVSTYLHNLSRRNRKI